MLGIGCLALEAVVWSSVLRVLEVSMAFPMSSMNFVVITLFSYLWLHERVTPRRWLGVGLILSGTCLVGLG